MHKAVRGGRDDVSRLKKKYETQEQLTPRNQE